MYEVKWVSWIKSFPDFNMGIWSMNSNKGILYIAFPKYFDHKTLLALGFGKAMLFIMSV